jgi:hypothetical protein
MEAVSTSKISANFYQNYTVELSRRHLFVFIQNFGERERKRPLGRPVKMGIITWILRK